MRSPDFLFTVPGADRLSRTGAILGVVAVSLAAGPATESALAAQDNQAIAQRAEQHIGTAVKGFYDPRTGEHGALYRAQQVRG